MCRPLDPVDLVLLEEELDPPGGPVTMRSLRDWTWFMSIAGAAEGSVTPHSFASRITLSAWRVLEQCLCGDAAPNQAGAPSAFCFSTTQLFSELRAADCGDVPTGTAPMITTS